MKAKDWFVSGCLCTCVWLFGCVVLLNPLSFFHECGFFEPHQNTGPGLGRFIGSVHDQIPEPPQLFHQRPVMKRSSTKVQFSGASTGPTGKRLKQNCEDYQVNDSLTCYISPAGRLSSAAPHSEHCTRPSYKNKFPKKTQFISGKER